MEESWLRGRGRLSGGEDGNGHRRGLMETVIRQEVRDLAGECEGLERGEARRLRKVI